MKAIVGLTIVALVAVGMNVGAQIPDATVENCFSLEQQADAAQRAGTITDAQYRAVMQDIGTLSPEGMTADQVNTRARARVRMAHMLINNENFSGALTALSEAELGREDLRFGSLMYMRMARERAFRLNDNPTSGAAELDAAIYVFDTTDEGAITDFQAKLATSVLRRRMKLYDTTVEQDVALTKRLILLLALDESARWTIHDQRRVAQSRLSLAQRTDLAVVFEDAADLAKSSVVAAQFYQLSRSYRD